MTLRFYASVIAFVLMLVIDVSAQDILHLRAIYSVPLNQQQAHLSSVNSFPILEYTVDRAVVGHEKMSLTLPRDLTAGESRRVDFHVVEHVEKTRKLVGTDGATATCHGAWVAMTCQFDFGSLNLDLDKSIKFLQMKYGATQRAAHLIELAGFFGNDPIGVGQTSPLAEACENCTQTLGLWKIWFRDFSASPGRFTLDMGPQEGAIYSNWDRGSFHSLTFQESGVSGEWSIGSQRGWFRAKIKDQKWSGEWGYLNQGLVQGRLSGSRIN